MKKGIAVLLTFCIVSVLAVIQVSAAASPAVRLSSHEAEAGDTVKITVSIDDFSQVTDPDGSSAKKPIDDLFSAIQLKIYYNANQFDLTEYVKADETAGKPSPVKLNGAFAADIVKRSDSKGDYIYFSVMCVSGNGLTLADKADIAEITLKVKSGAAGGKYDFTPEAISLATGIKGQPKNVAAQFTMQKGQITISGDDISDGGISSNDMSGSSTVSNNISSGRTSSDDTGSSITSDTSNGGLTNDRTDSANSAGSGSNPGNPKTGDIVILGAALLLAGGLVMVVVSKKRKAGSKSD